MRKEVLPIGLGACALAIAYTYKTEIENLLPSTQETLSSKDERQISKKLGDLLKYKYRYGSIAVSDDLIDL